MAVDSPPAPIRMSSSTAPGSTSQSARSKRGVTALPLAPRSRHQGAGGQRRLLPQPCRVAAAPPTSSLGGTPMFHVKPRLSLLLLLAGLCTNGELPGRPGPWSEKRTKARQELPQSVPCRASISGAQSASGPADALPSPPHRPSPLPLSGITWAFGALPRSCASMPRERGSAPRSRPGAVIGEEGLDAIASWRERERTDANCSREGGPCERGDGGEDEMGRPSPSGGAETPRRAEGRAISGTRLGGRPWNCLPCRRTPCPKLRFPRL